MATNLSWYIVISASVCVIYVCGCVILISHLGMQLLVYILVRVHFMMHTVDELEGPVWHQHLARMRK